MQRRLQSTRISGPNRVLAAVSIQVASTRIPNRIPGQEATGEGVVVAVLAVAEASRGVGDISPASVVAKLQEGIAVRRGWILVIDAAPGVVARMNVHRFAYDNLRGIALVVKEVIAGCSSCRPTTNEAIGSENVGELQVSAGVKFADCVALVIKEIGLRPGFGLGVVLVGVNPVESVITTGLATGINGDLRVLART